MKPQCLVPPGRVPLPVNPLLNDEFKITKMKRTPQPFILATMLVLSFFLAGNGGYVLPAPDGGERHPSPPSLVGTLKTVSADEITVLPKGDIGPVVVRITKDTAIFTTYGGYVPPEKLVREGTIEVWFTPESLANKWDNPVAAVVRVEIRKVP